MKKIYKCCICHKELEEEPIRLVKELYEYQPYKQYKVKANYDFCKRCYSVIEKFINKHKDREVDYERI